jgi:hypothetical protein
MSRPSRSCDKGCQPRLGGGELDLLGQRFGHHAPADEPEIAPPTSTLARLLGLPDPTALKHLDLRDRLALDVPKRCQIGIIGGDLQGGLSGRHRERGQGPAADRLGPLQREDRALGLHVGRRGRSGQWREAKDSFGNCAACTGDPPRATA